MWGGIQGVGSVQLYFDRPRGTPTGLHVTARSCTRYSCRQQTHTTIQPMVAMDAST